MIFSPLEDQSYDATNAKQCFLVGYRALARELHVKSATAKHGLQQGDLSEGLGRKGRFLQPSQDGFVLGMLRGRGDMRSHKAEYDNVLVEERYHRVAGHVIELAEPPPVMCCGGVFPEHTFSGERIQRLGPSSGRFSLVCFSAFASGKRGVIVFSWLKDECGDRFGRSLSDIADSQLAGALLRFFFESCENVHIRPSWWSDLAVGTRNTLIKHMDASSELVGVSRDYYSDDGVDYAAWPILSRHNINLTYD